jgi:uncharacterized protein
MLSSFRSLLETSRSSTRLFSNTSKTFLLEYKYIENMIEKRAPHRSAHLEHADNFVKRNILIAGGAIVPEVDRGVLVFKADSAAVVEEFAKADPYVKQGLVTSYTVKEWMVVIGKV